MRILERLNDDWLLATEIHKLEARLWRKTQRDNLRVVMLTSAERGEGKSTTVAYLAAALALHPDRRILAVDLDFRAPRLNTHFEIEVRHAFGEALRGECALQDCILRTEIDSLNLVLPPADGDDPGLLLHTPEMSRAFESFRKGYDLVLIDVPALVPVADASAVLPFADGVILMAMAGKTTKPMLSRAREVCLGMDANILGLIVGNLKEPGHGYGSSGYYYGYRREKSKHDGDNASKPRA
jgi:capsular exopolysaccharide synthesis family protein